MHFKNHKSKQCQCQVASQTKSPLNNKSHTQIYYATVKIDDILHFDSTFRPYCCYTFVREEKDRAHTVNKTFFNNYNQDNYESF